MTLPPISLDTTPTGLLKLAVRLESAEDVETSPYRIVCEADVLAAAKALRALATSSPPAPQEDVQMAEQHRRLCLAEGAGEDVWPCGCNAQIVDSYGTRKLVGEPCDLHDVTPAVPDHAGLVTKLEAAANEIAEGRADCLKTHDESNAEMVAQGEPDAPYPFNCHICSAEQVYEAVMREALAALRPSGGETP